MNAIEPLSVGNNCHTKIDLIDSIYQTWKQFKKTQLFLFVNTYLCLF